MFKFLFALFLTSFPVWADEPIKLVVPFAPGSSIDLIARIISQPLSRELKIPIIVENRVGAGGDIANKHVAESDRRSITLLINSSGLAANTAFVVPDYDLNDLVPLVNLGSSPVIFVTSKKSNIRNIRDFLSHDDLTYGSSGINSLTYLYGELLRIETKKKMTHIPYKGVNQSLPDIVSGQLDSVFLFYSTAVSYINDDKVHAIAVASTNRLPLLPNVPTFTEVGITGLDTIDPWFAIFSNNTTQVHRLEQIRQALVVAMKDPNVKQKLTDAGLVLPRDPGIKRSFLMIENQKYRSLIKKYKLAQ